MAGFIRKRSNKQKTTWQVVLDDGVGEKGSHIKKSGGTFNTKKEAELKLRELLNAKDKGISIKLSKVTLEKYMRDWLRDHITGGLSPTSADGYNVNIEKHIIPYIGKIVLSELRPGHIKGLYDKLIAEGRSDGQGGLSPASIRYIHRNLRAALQEALRMRIINENPASLVKLPKVVKYKPTIYDENEIKKLIEAVRNTDLEISITLDIVCGLRRGELLALRWCDIDLKNKTLTVKNNFVSTTKGTFTRETKTEAGQRIIRIPESIITMLEKHRIRVSENKSKLGEAYIDKDLICCQANGEPYEPKYFSKKFSKFLRIHKLKKLRLHDLRHTNATLMLRYGIPAKIVSQRLGHSSVNVTLDIYTHVQADMQTEVTDKIENGIMKSIPDKTEDPDK